MSSVSVDFTPQEQAILHLVLKGSSVIDWPRLFFKSADEIKAFLKINEYDVSRPRDFDRLMGVHNEAVGYLQRELAYELSDEVRRPDKIVELFQAATEGGPLQVQACSILKTMNIINHIDGRELLYNCPISLRDLFSLVEDKIERMLSLLNRPGGLVLRYQGGRKPKESLITKLLCKRETIAAQINDRVRYRIVTKKKEEILKVLLRLFETILPFNYLIPNASVNELIRLDLRDKVRAIVKAVRRPFARPSAKREYSGTDYQVCKFVVDIPIRMENFLARSGGPIYRESFGTIAYVLVEFQIVDEETDRRNNTGGNSHENYKKRQKSGVMGRLSGG